MIEQGRPCVQIAQQLQAVESAIEHRQKGADPRSHQRLHRAAVKGHGIHGSGAAKGVEADSKILVTR